MLEHERQAVLSSVFQSAVDSIVIIDEVGKIESVNHAVEQTFGYTAAEMLGQNVKMLMPSPYREQHDESLLRYHETGERRIIGIGREVLGKRKDGSLFPIHLAVSEVDAGGRKLFSGIMRDISELKETEARLKRLNDTLDQRIQQQASELQRSHAALIEKEKLAMLGQMSSGIAHEIRNPLNTIKTSSYYLLNADQLAGEKSREHLTRIDRQVMVIDRIVTALSELAKLPESDSIPCDMQEMVNALAQRLTLPDDVRIEHSFPADLPPALANEKQLSIAIKNLIFNARDAMPHGGVLTLSGKAEGDFIVVSVRDTGTGMAPDVLARISEAFFSTKANGLGLGLAITKAIAEKHHGRLRFETRPGEGSTFSLLLPMHRE